MAGAITPWKKRHQTRPEAGHAFYDTNYFHQKAMKKIATKIVIGAIETTIATGAIETTW